MNPDIQIFRAATDEPVVAVPLDDSCVCTLKQMGEQAVRMNVSAAEPLALRAGDSIEWRGVRYALAEEPDYKRAEGVYRYTLTFHAPAHRLSYLLHKDEGSLHFPYAGNLAQQLDALYTSIGRETSGFTIEIEEGIAGADELRHLDFEQTYCLDALTRICEAFDTEWRIDGLRIRIGRFESAAVGLFRYGRGRGLYSLEKIGVSNASVVTRLYGRGSSGNLPADYRRSDNPRPETLVFDGLFLEKNVARYGVREEVVTFDDIYPRLRNATVQEVVEPDDMNKATEWTVRVSLPFDLNDCLSEDQAQIKFTGGELTGEGFVITHYDHATGLLKFNVSEDNGYSLPSATRRPRAGDPYVLLGIVMPHSYVAEAEAELKEATQRELDRRCEKRYAYRLEIDPRYVRRESIRVGVGDTILVQEEDETAAPIEIRVSEVSYPLQDPDRLSLVLSDTPVYTSYAEKIENDIRDVTHEVNTVYREARAFSRRAWRDAEELTRMIDALRTELLLVGNHAGQFVISSVFTANPSNDPHRFTATEGKLQHAVYKGSTEGVWLLGGVGLTLESDAPYYLYARCSRTSNNGFYVASTDRIEVEAIEGWYHFPVGVVSSPFEGARVFHTTYGFTQIAGGAVTTGKIQDAARRLVIDLDNGTITGPVTFKNDDHFETLADGGLLLTSLIKMMTDGVETGGLAANLDNILLWGGGTYDQAKENAANTILRHDGSGQLARGKIWWNQTGDLTLDEGAKIGKFTIKDGVLVWKEGDREMYLGQAGSTEAANSSVAHFSVSRTSTGGPNLAITVNGSILMTDGGIFGFGIAPYATLRDRIITTESYVICNNTEKITVTLPSNPCPGRMIYVRRNHSGAVDVKTTDGSLIRKGNSNFTSHTIGEVGWTHMYIYYGGYWLINLITH